MFTRIFVIWICTSIQIVSEQFEIRELNYQDAQEIEVVSDLLADDDMLASIGFDMGHQPEYFRMIVGTKRDLCQKFLFARMLLTIKSVELLLAFVIVTLKSKKYFTL